MKYAFLFLFSAIVALAQPIASPPPTFIKGEMAINFNARTRNEEGVTNRYVLNINVNDSVLFRGNIEHLPTITSTFGGQKSKLTFNVDADVVNPRNVSQTRNVGKISGSVPISERNVYNWAGGNVVISVFGIGSAPGFTGKFGGIALGKPPATSNFMNKAKESLSLSNKKGKIIITKYDKMEFQGHTLASGPVAVYPEVQVNGPLFYDYDRSAWFLQNVTVQYSADGRRMVDVLTGNIRWIESPNYKISGLGEYQFDIRINEPAPSEAAAFSAPADEAAFFASDTTTPSLVGTMKYKDTIINGTVTASTIQIDLKGTAITKQQVMYLCKLVILSSVVPMNDQ